jgi:hypothetical protein
VSYAPVFIYLPCSTFLFSANEEKFRVKATLNTPMGALGLAAQVYLCEGTVHAVEVQRRHGSILKFHEVYHLIYGSLASIVVSSPAAAAANAEALKCAISSATAREASLVTSIKIELQ